MLDDLPCMTLDPAPEIPRDLKYLVALAGHVRGCHRLQAWLNNKQRRHLRRVAQLRKQGIPSDEKFPTAMLPPKDVKVVRGFLGQVWPSGFWTGAYPLELHKDVLGATVSENLYNEHVALTEAIALATRQLSMAEFRRFAIEWNTFNPWREPNPVYVGVSLARKPRNPKELVEPWQYRFLYVLQQPFPDYYWDPYEALNVWCESEKPRYLNLPLSDRERRKIIQLNYDAGRKEFDDADDARLSDKRQRVWSRYNREKLLHLRASLDEHVAHLQERVRDNPSYTRTGVDYYSRGGSRPTHHVTHGIEFRAFTPDEGERMRHFWEEKRIEQVPAQLTIFE